MQRLLGFIVLLFVIQVTTAADDSLPSGALQRGTLANAQLIQDAKVGVAQKVGGLGCTQLGDVETYVTALPSGKPGSRRWKELWIVAGCNKKYPVAIEFFEEGKDANWVIR